MGAWMRIKPAVVAGEVDTATIPYTYVQAHAPMSALMLQS